MHPALFRPSCSTGTAEKLLANCVTCCQSERRCWGPSFGVDLWAAKSRTRNGHGLSVTKCCPPMSGRKSDPTFGPQKAPHCWTMIQAINRFLSMHVLQTTGCTQTQETVEGLSAPAICVIKNGMPSGLQKSGVTFSTRNLRTTFGHIRHLRGNRRWPPRSTAGGLLATSSMARARCRPRAGHDMRQGR